MGGESHKDETMQSLKLFLSGRDWWQADVVEAGWEGLAYNVDGNRWEERGGPGLVLGGLVQNSHNDIGPETSAGNAGPLGKKNPKMK